MPDQAKIHFSLLVFVQHFPSNLNDGMPCMVRCKSGLNRFVPDHKLGYKDLTYLPSPPLIIAKEIIPTGESRQNIKTENKSTIT
jgi:hypothetical protein